MWCFQCCPNSCQQMSARLLSRSHVKTPGRGDSRSSHGRAAWALEMGRGFCAISAGLSPSAGRGFNTQPAQFRSLTLTVYQTCLLVFLNMLNWLNSSLSLDLPRLPFQVLDPMWMQAPSDLWRGEGWCCTTCDPASEWDFMWRPELCSSF